MTKPEQFDADKIKGVGGQSNPFLTQETFERNIKELKDSLDRFAKPVGYVLVGIIVVLFVGFVTVLVSMQALVNESNNFKMSAYEQLLQEVQTLQKSHG